MPGAERRLLLLLGHAANEINVIQRLILMSGQETPEIKFVDLVQAGQTFILMRMLIGKLHEAWDLFTKRFQGDQQIKSKYLPRLGAEATTALEQLNKHFGRRSSLTLIRNKFSFHYRDDEDLAEKSFREIPEDDAWHFYLSHIQGNCFYYASELVIAGGVIRLANQARNNGQPYLEQSARAFENLCNLIVTASGHVMTLFGQCITEIASEHLTDAVVSEPTAIVDAPSLKNVHIPFFLDEAEFKPGES